MRGVMGITFKPWILKPQSDNTYKSWQRACIPRLNLQRFVEQVITEVLLAHILHGIEVLEELLLVETKHGVTAAA